MHTFNAVHLGSSPQLPYEVFMGIYAVLGFRDKLSLSFLNMHFHHLLRDLELCSRAEGLKNRTFHKINKETKIWSLSFKSKEIEDQHEIALHAFLKRCARIQGLYQQKAFPYHPCEILNVLNQMFNTLKIEGIFQYDNQLEDCRLLETSSFDLKQIQGKLTLQTPSFLFNEMKCFKLVFKKHKEKAWIDSNSYQTKNKWHYWINLQIVDGSLMNFQELNLRIAIEICFNAIVRMASQLNQDAIPLLFKKCKEDSFGKYPAITCNKYGVFLKSKKIPFRYPDESLNEFENFAMYTPNHWGGYQNAEWIKTHTFKSALREHVIDYTLQKYNRKFRAARMIKQEE